MEPFYAVFWVYPAIFVFGGSYAVYYSRKMNRQVAIEREQATIEERIRWAERAAAPLQPDDPYTVLGVGRDATPEELRRAYHAACMRWHPDRIDATDTRGAAEAEGRIRLINRAYEALSTRQSLVAE